jgi:hypothetical protein
MLTDGRYLFAYGIFYPEGDELKFEAKHLVFVSRNVNEWRFRRPTRCRNGRHGPAILLYSPRPTRRSCAFRCASSRLG